MQRLALLIAAIVLAGCTSSDRAVDDVGTDGSPDEVASALGGPALHSKTGEIDAGVGASAADQACWLEVGADNVLEFGVPAGATALVLELEWNDDVQDLTLSASPPDAANQPCPPNVYHAEGMTGLRDHPRLVIQDPTPGRWTLGAQANGLVYAIQYELHASVFTGPVPDGYTAIA